MKDVQQVPIQKLRDRFEMSLEMFESDSVRGMAFDRSIEKLAVRARRDGLTVVDDPKVVSTMSRFRVRYPVAAPRRWWHRLLFLHPTEMGERIYDREGFHSGAHSYVFVTGCHVAKLPPGYEDVRLSPDRPNVSHLAFPFPPADAKAWAL